LAFEVITEGPASWSRPFAFSARKQAASLNKNVEVLKNSFQHAENSQKSWSRPFAFSVRKQTASLSKNNGSAEKPFSACWKLTEEFSGMGKRGGQSTRLCYLWLAI
jgi:hypothetical protein